MNPQVQKRFLEEEIRPERLMTAKQDCVEADRKFILDHRDQWVEVPCPACDSSGCRFYGKKQGFVYVECESCGTVFTNPRPSLALMRQFYAGSRNYAYWNEYIFPATEAVRRERIFRPRAERVAETCRRLGLSGGVLLEVGAGFGIFCEEIQKESLFDRVIALESTPDLAQTCRSRGLEVIQEPVEDVRLSERVDVVVAFEVIEHLFSPRQFIQKASELLKPEGLLVLTCPNVRGFDVSTLHMISNTFDHEHVNYFHTGSLPYLVTRCGFKVLDVQTPGRLDAELVRKQAQSGTLDLSGQPFLREILLDRWEEQGNRFQKFLAENGLSSHMWVLAQK